MYKTKVKEYLFLHLVLVIYSFVAIFSKLASKETFLSLKYMIYYGMVIGFLFIYALLWQQVLKKIPLTVAFANKSIVIIWSIIWGMVLFQEKLTVTMVIGALFIIVGICCVVTDNE